MTERKSVDEKRHFEICEIFQNGAFVEMKRQNEVAMYACASDLLLRP